MNLTRSELRHEDGRGLRLLSLDGGGIKGLSQLYILQNLMRSIDGQRPPEPCEVFDLICGSSTGGLLAIMLGRLRMSIEESIQVYQDMCGVIFKRKATLIPISLLGRLKARYSSDALADSIREVIAQRGFSVEEPLKEEPEAAGPVTVVVACRVADSGLVTFSSHPIMDDNHFNLVKIWEAARATSAAPAFFDPIAIGPDRVQYIDGGVGANNPVQFAMLAAKEVWPKSTVRCLVSIGAGYKRTSSFPSDAVGLAKHAIALMTDTETIAQRFAHHNRIMIIEDRYFRFSVDHGLEDILFDEWQATDRILAHSQRYCNEIKHDMTFERCAKSLTQYPRQQQGEATTRNNIDREIGHENVPIAETSRRSGEASLSSEDTPETYHKTSQKFQYDDPTIAMYSHPKDLLESFSGFLADSLEIKALLVSGMKKIGYKRLEKNFSILVEDFAERLASEEGLHDISQLIGARSLESTQLVFGTLPADILETSEETLPSYEDVEQEVHRFRNEIQDLGETQRKFRNLDVVQLREAALQISSLHSQGLAVRAELIQDLRGFVFPSTRSYIREVLLPSLPATICMPIHSVAVRVSWEIQSFLAVEYSPENDIASMLTITGGISSAQALSCGEYMHQTWAKTGSNTLLAIKRALKTGSSYYQHSASHSVRFDLDDPDEPTTSETSGLNAPLLVEINGNVESIIESIEQLAWLASAFRLSQTGLTCLSRVEIRAVPTGLVDRSTFFDLILCPLRTVRESELGLGSCWTMLYPGSVVACGFPIAHRNATIGLEIPWSLMLSFSGAKYPIEFQDSMIIRQDPLIIYPVAKNESGTQWHAVEGGLDSFFKEIMQSRLLPIRDDIELIIQGRHFLGWLKNACVNLGTQQPQDQSSGADCDLSRGLQVGEEFSTTLNIKPPWVGVNLGVKVIMPRSQKQKIEGRQPDYKLKLHTSSRTQAIYYDCKSKIGWLVPELSILLHMAYAALLKYCPDIDALHQLYYANLEADGGIAALRTIEECGNISLWTTEEDDKEKNFLFKDLIKDFLVWFDNRKQAMGTRIEHRELLPSLDLRGWDFGDLRDFSAIYRIRKVAAPLLDRPDWWDLAQEPNTLVILGTNAGQVISPNWQLERPCRSWTSIPTDHGLFTSTVYCLKDICRPRENVLQEGRLSKELLWHQPKNSNPFGDCASTSCNPVQKLRKRGFLRGGLHGVTNPPEVRPEGAVIFGLPSATLAYVKKQEKSLGPCAQTQRPDANPIGRVYLQTRTPSERIRHAIPSAWKTACLPILKSQFLWCVILPFLAVSALVTGRENLLRGHVKGG